MRTRLRFTPARRRGVELLDDPDTPTVIREAAMRDVARANALFGGYRAAVPAAVEALRTVPRSAVLLDVGTGSGDVPARILTRANRLRHRPLAVGLDNSSAMLRVARGRLDAVAAGSAFTLPMRDGAADVVICSQLLHHFERADVIVAVRELHRVSRQWVVVSDLRRSWLAAAGFWLASTILRFHPVTRHDGVVSVLRGFTGPELERLVFEAVGVQPRVARGLFWRLTAVWSKSGTSQSPAYG